MRPLLKRIPAVPAPLGLLILLILAFGVMIPWLGFYWDDWPVILTGRLLGADGYRAFYEFDRPVSAWTYILTFPLLGSSPAGWHVFTLLLRWLTSVTMWWTMTRLWPARRTELTWAAFLFAIYPVFIQQSISVAYSQHWICYLLFFFSWGAMVQALRWDMAADRPGQGRGRWGIWLLTILALASSLLQLLTMEYFAGLELARPLLLWMLFGEQNLPARKRIAAVLRAWLPYLLVLVGFVVWRLFFLKFPGEAANPPLLLQRMLTDPVGSGLRLVQIAAQDVVFMLVNVWSNILSSSSILLNDRFVLFSWALGAAAAAAAFLFNTPRAEIPTDGKARWVRQAMLLGASALFLAMIPVWVTDRQVIVGLYSNRFGLAAMFGASLLIAAFIEGWISKQGQRTALYCLLIALAVGLHLRTGNDYRWSWELQKRFAWQLSWRAPTLEPGTALFSDGEIFQYVGLYSTSAIVNLTYPPTGQGSELPYWFYSMGREFAFQMPEMLAGMPLNTKFRNYNFKGHTHEGVVLHYDPTWTACLQLLPPEDDNNFYLPEITRTTLKLTDLSRISPADQSPDYPPREIFGPEPEPNWCYYYQKAGLAAQQDDWQQVVDLAQQAGERGLTIESTNNKALSEWLPFIRAYAHVGQWSEARDISLEILERSPRMNVQMCAVWDQLGDVLPQDSERDAAVRDVWAASGCP